MKTQTDLSQALEKIEVSHQAIANSISNYGDQTKRLQIRFDEVTSKLDDVIEQTTKTNGNVRGLQLWQAGVKGWIAGVGICLSVIIVLGTAVFYSEINGVKSLIDQHTNAQVK